ncbi:MAG: GAF domain-containing protein [Calditrichaeota bacterium]|nr:MAG: GAF domain-containing protein [Calditrichota bacterium]
MKLKFKYQFPIAALLMAILMLGMVMTMWPKGSGIEKQAKESLEKLREIEGPDLEFVKTDLVKIEQEARSLHSYLIFWLVVIGAGAGLLAIYFLKVIFVRLDLILRTIKDISAEKFDSPLPPPSEDEIGEIVRCLSNVQNMLKNKFEQMERLVNALIDISSHHNPDKILTILLKRTKEVLGVKYAALGIFDENKKVKEFLTEGISEEAKARIAHYPEGKGLLGYIHETGKILRTNDLQSHARSAGFPSGHPEMKSLLAMPLIDDEGKSLGNLYVSEKKDGSGFTLEDEYIIKALGLTAINNIKLSEVIKSIVDTKDQLERESRALLEDIQELASGNFAINFNQHMHHEIMKKIQNDLRLMSMGLKDLLLQVRDMANTIASSATEITASTEQLAAGSQEQSAQAMEVSAAVEEMTQNIASNSENAMRATEIAGKSGKEAQESAKIIEDTVNKMNEIAEVMNNALQNIEHLDNAVKNIGDIVSVINEIADQTNLLALNAAIEAARAGEHGKGFAVVAEEVRKLAERSSQSTKEIVNIIKNVQSETERMVQIIKRGSESVEKGVELADATRSSLDKILENTQNVLEMMRAIAQANEEQKTTSEQVASSVEGIANVANESAEGVSQIAIAANDLNNLTEQMARMMNMFRIDDSQSEQTVEVAGFSAESNRNIGSINITEVKISHRMWKKKLIDCINGKAQYDPDVVGNYYGCTLGQWYYSLDDPEIKSDRDFQELEKHHARLHEVAADIVRDCIAGNQDSAVIKLEDIDKISEKVVHYLDRIEPKIRVLSNG